MTPLNWAMNRVADLSESESILKKIAARATIAVGVLPFEVLAIAQNLIKLPFSTGFMLCRIPLKLANLVARSKSLRNLEMSMPGPGSLFATALKVIGYALGTIFSILGFFISPRKNFDLHVILGLVRDEKAEAQRAQIELQTAKRKEAVAQELEANIKKIALANSAKIAEKVTQLEIEAQKQQKVLESLNLNERKSAAVAAAA